MDFAAIGVDGAGVGVGADLHPSITEIPMYTSANGATLYQPGATARVRVGEQEEG